MRNENYRLSPPRRCRRLEEILHDYMRQNNVVTDNNVFNSWFVHILNILSPFVSWDLLGDENGSTRHDEIFGVTLLAQCVPDRYAANDSIRSYLLKQYTQLRCRIFLRYTWRRFKGAVSNTDLGATFKRSTIPVEQLKRFSHPA